MRPLPTNNIWSGSSARSSSSSSSWVSSARKRKRDSTPTNGAAAATKSGPTRKAASPLSTPRSRTYRTRTCDPCITKAVQGCGQEHWFYADFDWNLRLQRRRPKLYPNSAGAFGSGFPGQSALAGLFGDIRPTVGLRRIWCHVILIPQSLNFSKVDFVFCGID